MKKKKASAHGHKVFLGKHPILKGMLFGLLAGLFLAAIFLLTKDVQGLYSKWMLAFRVFIFIATLPVALPFFFIPVDNLTINPYTVTTTLLLLNWTLMGGLIVYTRENRERIIPIVIALSLVVVGGGFYLVLKTLATISKLTS